MSPHVGNAWWYICLRETCFTFFLLYFPRSMSHAQIPSCASKSWSYIHSRAIFSPFVFLHLFIFSIHKFDPTLLNLDVTYVYLKHLYFLYFSPSTFQSSFHICKFLPTLLKFDLTYVFLLVCFPPPSIFLFLYTSLLCVGKIWPSMCLRKFFPPLIFFSCTQVSLYVRKIWPYICLREAYYIPPSFFLLSRLLVRNS